VKFTPRANLNFFGLASSINNDKIHTKQTSTDNNHTHTHYNDNNSNLIKIWNLLIEVLLATSATFLKSSHNCTTITSFSYFTFIFNKSTASMAKKEHFSSWDRALWPTCMQKSRKLMVISIERIVQTCTNTRLSALPGYPSCQHLESTTFTKTDRNYSITNKLLI